jgi:Ca-activated chloride channel homolog
MNNTFENMDYYLALDSAQAQRMREQQGRPSEGVSKLDLKAPSGAKREFEKGVQLLLHKDSNGAVPHLSKAIADYPKFVAAHSALGTAYMELGKNDQAREEFEQATLLDDHLPNSFLNLCHSELALKNYPAAEQAIRKASSISPLNLGVSAMLVHVEVLNHNYQGAIATAHQVHEGKHDSAAVVHFLAARAWGVLGNLPEMEAELKTFLAEDSKNPNAGKARELIAQIDDIRMHPRVVTITHEQQQPSEAAVAAQREQQKQVAEAERMCVGCFDANVPQPAMSNVDPTSPPAPEPVSRGDSGWVLHKSVDEVALFFAATDHGRSVSDLTQQEVSIRDDHQVPAAVIGFRNQSELPLRLGLVIDTSESIVDRFSFEQGAAAGFLQKVLINKDDLAFVVGFSNAVLMVQDFTADQSQISHAVGQLAPAGGTALWDAVAYASHKLASRVESEPVAKILVVISDGNDNSSKTSLKEAIEAAERGEVIVYTISTAESMSDSSGPSVGDHALRILSEQSGGSAFTPGSVRSLNRSLAELQEVIRSRYLLSYKPAGFQPDGRYRSIDIDVQKSGRKLRVYARKGYYARESPASAENF